MAHILSIIKTGFLSLAVMTLTLGLPLGTLVDGTVAADGTTCTTPVVTDPGVHAPTGAAAGNFTYNCGTGLWENAHYTYNPVTQVYTALDPVIYTYNTTTGQYDYSTWEYSPARNTYYQLAASVATPPFGAQTIGTPPPVVTPTPSPQLASPAATASNIPTGTNGNLSATGPGSLNSGTSGLTGPDSTNTSNLVGTSNTNLNNNTNVSLINNLYGRATSGNAYVVGNTTAGGASTGDAKDIANVVNLLQSSTNAFGTTGPVTFVANINGDVNGDLLLDPSNLGSIQNAGNVTLTNDTKINNSLNANINNNINVAAATGNANVANNTEGGNATSGNASAIADLINVINSAITAGRSFIGVVNINGNLNGDILLPPGFIDQLVAANVPTVTVTAPSSVNTGSTSLSDKTTVNNTNNLGINNNINANATTGQANVTDNTTAGNATSGNAMTHITAFNLTGSKIVGANDLLVFVNVLGQWVGLIVNAPAGATAAELGGGITQNDTTIANTTDVNNTTKERINNNVNVAAASGDATVSHNTTGGNAKTGDAKAAINLLNVENSNLAFSNWFGVLFINVFGTWHGSFGINTSAGDKPVTAPSVGYGGGDANTPTEVFRFVPSSSSSTSGSIHSSGSSTGRGGTSSSYQAVPVGNSSLPPAVSNAAVLASSISRSPSPTLHSQSSKNSFWRAASIIAGVITLYILADALLTAFRQKRRA